jgi:hypothetical protein
MVSFIEPNGPFDSTTRTFLWDRSKKDQGRIHRDEFTAILAANVPPGRDLENGQTS